MGECLLVKTDKGHFLPLDGALADVSAGEVIKVKYSLARNPKFHRKMFALFKFVIDALPDPEPVKVHGVMVTPKLDFDTARKFLTVKAGFYDVIMLPDGTCRLQAKSLSYASMDNEEFARVYSAIIDVALQFLPYAMTGEELNKSVNNLMGFA